MIDPEIQIVFINAKAGTGKTFLATTAAYHLHKTENKELEYIFSPVEEGRLGFLPGDLDDKTTHYVQPLRDSLVSLGLKPNTNIFDPKLPDDHVINRGAWIKPQSHVFARGTNKINKTVIVDEMQNWTIHEIKKILTRVHENTKVIAIGHTGQIDLKYPQDSGFSQTMYHFKDEPYARIAHLTRNFRGQLAQHADELR
jgi:phosphate starvation-inducible PhoH-like protein